MADEVLCLNLTHLAPDLQLNILKQLSIRDIANIASTSKACAALARSDHVWTMLLERDFAGTDAPTLAAALRRGASPREAYSLLAARRTCIRCKLPFTDGANGPSACNFHPGVLFSGGLINGAALRYTCCGRRAHQKLAAVRDANGCRSCYHVDLGESLWSPEGGISAAVRTTAVKIPARAATGASSCGGSSGIGSPVQSSSPRGAVEWHPNQRPGLLELPTRLLLSNSA